MKKSNKESVKSFCDILHREHYKFIVKDECVTVTHQGTVDLSSLTTLPDNVKFENQGTVDLSSLTTLPDNVKFENQGDVYLRSLTTLPDNVKFENQGSVYLRSLTTLPDNVKFENQGSVYLSSLTTLPDNVKFENQGSVYLSSLTTLPDNVKFENQGSVYLSSLNGKYRYNGRNIEILNVDDRTMLITSRKINGDTEVLKARYFGGGPIRKLKSCYIAKKGNFYAHGDTVLSAIEDVNFKIARQSGDISEVIQRVKQSGSVTVTDYRLITGACRE